MEPLKFGIIGCSRIAKRSVIPAIIKSEYAEVEIIGSRSTNKAKEFANEFKCEKFGTYEDVISNDAVDVVYISTPIGTMKNGQLKQQRQVSMFTLKNLVRQILIQQEEWLNLQKKTMLD